MIMDIMCILKIVSYYYWSFNPGGIPSVTIYSVCVYVLYYLGCFVFEVIRTSRQFSDPQITFNIQLMVA